MFLIGLFAISLGIFTYSLKPEYKGEKQLAKLSDTVEVYYDNYGIPHIYGENEADAFRTLGYVHAQDRLWQMELLRRIGRGGLSELFGEDKALSTDKFFLSLGIDDNSIATINKLNRNSDEIQLAEAYLDGINQFIEEGPTPLEFYLTGIEKEPFTLRDIYNTMGYMAFSFAMAHKTDPLLTDIKNKLGPKYLTDLEIDVNPNTEWIKNHKEQWADSIQNNISTMIFSVLGEISLPLFEGSNSWVIAPEKTKNGKVIFANDPHIGFAQPSIWYEAHVITPTYEKYGYHIAGVPFPLLGHNRNLAYGMTMFENDDVDFYFEEQNSKNNKQYKTKSGWQDYEIVTKSIKVKDSEPISFSFKKTNHGPILNQIADQITQERPVSMSWTYTKGDNKIIKALYGISQAEDKKTFEAALPFIHAPGLNIMYGDAKGNIAWWATAKLYKIPDSLNTKFIFEPNTGLSESKDYLPFSENPHAINPPWHYVYSANNQPDSISGMKYPGYYLPENRAKRIVDLLENKNDWDVNSAENMITDITSSVNPSIIKSFKKSIDETKLSEIELQYLNELIAWQGDYTIESTVPTIFHRWEYYFLKNTFKDELGSKMFDQFLSTHLHKRLIAPMAEKETSVWWDNVSTTSHTETKNDIIITSFKEAIADLESSLGKDSTTWQWGNVHTLEHKHPIGEVEALRSFFNVGPFPVHGTRAVINNMAFTYSDENKYDVTSGPSSRRIIDFSDIENSKSILPTGNSGNPFSKHYKDQAKMYINGEFRKMMLNKEEIQQDSHDKLVFEPNK